MSNNPLPLLKLTPQQQLHIQSALDRTKERRDEINFSRPDQDEERIRYHAALSGAIEAYQNLLMWDQRVLEELQAKQQAAMNKEMAGETIQDNLRAFAENLPPPPEEPQF